MRRPSILISFVKYTDANLKAKGYYIFQSMTNNPVFANPIPALIDVQTALNDYSTALLDAGSLDRNAVAQKNQTRATLEGLLRQLGLYVMIAADGNAADLTSSGY